MQSIFESRLFGEGAANRGILLEDEFRYGDLSPQDKDALFSNFEDSYKRSVGSSHDRRWFEHRAYGWTFWGSVGGGIAARQQHPEIKDANGGTRRADLWMLKASYGSNGSMKDTLKGGREFIEKHGKEPAWAVLTPRLANLVVKFSKGDFMQATPEMVKALYPALTSSSQRGGAYFGHQIRCDENGRLWAKTPQGTDLEKVVIVNNAYLDLFPDYKAFVKEIANGGNVTAKPDEKVDSNVPMLLAAMGVLK